MPPSTESGKQAVRLRALFGGETEERASIWVTRIEREAQALLSPQPVVVDETGPVSLRAEEEERDHPGHRILVNGHGNRWCNDCEVWVHFDPSS